MLDRGLDGLCRVIGHEQDNDATRWTVERWAPGDGRVRFRVVEGTGSVLPMGEKWRTARELMDVLEAVAEVRSA